jgi:pilus assembly protein CpaF
MNRMRDGTRKVVQVSEVQGLEGDSIVMQDIFMFEQTDFLNSRVIGQLKSTGLRPKFSDKFAINNIEIPPNIFESSTVIGETF